MIGVLIQFKKDFSKYLKSSLKDKDYLDYIFGYDFEVKDSGSAGILIKDKSYCILVSGDFVYAFPRIYNFTTNSVLVER